MVYRVRRPVFWCLALGFALLGAEAAAATPSEHTWIEKLRSDSDEVKMQAAKELARVGSGAAVRPLLDAIRAVGRTSGAIGPVESAYGLAVEAIFARDPDGVLEAFRKALSDEDAEMRRVACEAAGWWIGTRAEERAEAFGKELVRLYENDRAPEVRRAALVAIWRIRVPGTPAILAKAIKIYEPGIRSAAANGFYWLGREALPAMDVLFEVIEHETEFGLSERFSAAAALGKIGAPALPRLMKICDKEEDGVYWAASALAQMGPEAAPAVPLLARLLREKGRDLRELREYARALGAIGGAALPALPALKDFALSIGRDWLENVAFEATSRIVRDALERSQNLEGGSGTERLLELLASEECHERWGAAEVLGDGKYQPASVVARRLGEVLEDRTEDLFVRRSAAVSLGRLGKAAFEAVPSLARAMRDRCAHVFVRRAAAAALGQVDKDAVALDALIWLYEDRTDDRESRWAAIRSVGGLGEKALPALSKLVSLLEDRSYNDLDRREVLTTIARLGTAAAKAIPSFVARIEDASEEEPLRWAAADLLPSLGPTGIGSVVNLLSHADPEVRRMALFALRGYGSAAGHAVEAVERLLADSDPEVRSEALRALATIRPAAKQNVQKEKP